jgi:hypothetical protein
MFLAGQIPTNQELGGAPVCARPDRRAAPTNFPDPSLPAVGT